MLNKKQSVLFDSDEPSPITLQKGEVLKLSEKWVVKATYCIYRGSTPPPLEDVIHLAGRGYRWIESEPTADGQGGLATYMAPTEDLRDAFTYRSVPVPDYIAKRRSDGNQSA